MSGWNIHLHQKHRTPIQSEGFSLNLELLHLSQNERSYPIIKRRIAWLIGKWVSESCISANNPEIWKILVHLLQDKGPGTDAVVRLTAAAAFRECVDVCIRFVQQRPTNKST